MQLIREPASKLHNQLDREWNSKTKGSSEGVENVTSLRLCESMCDSLGYMDKR
jgi:hypothetical protein